MKKLYGITVAMTTPFTEAGDVDLEAMAAHAEFLIRKGVHCLYPCGTTGEMLHLTTQERMDIAACVVKQANGRVPVYIHVGAPDLEDTVRMAKHAQQSGADGIGVVTPIGASEAQLEAYFKEVARSTSLPMYLYNIPQNAKSDISPALAQRLSENCQNIIGIKYSFMDLKRTWEYLSIHDGDFEVMHGSDRFVAPLMFIGCKGTISGNAGVYPEPYIELHEAAIAGDTQRVQHLMRLCTAVSKVLRGGKNVAYFKNALRYRGLSGGHMRVPQLDLTEEEALKQFQQLDALCGKWGLKRSGLED